MAIFKKAKKAETETIGTGEGGVVVAEDLPARSFLSENDQDRILASAREIIRQAKDARGSGAYLAALDTIGALARSIEGIVDRA